MNAINNAADPFLRDEYQHGFVTDIESDTLPAGLNEEVIRAISAKKREPQWMLERRLEAHRHWLTIEGAEARLAGLFTAGNQQLNDIDLNIDHAVPGCISQSDFKGLLHGKGRGVFDGRILVGAQAQHTEAHLNNANLLLSRNAEVDTKPQLEIYADNVKCSHGTTVGQLEESQLFYLRSRGIDAAQAKRLLCLGFAGEILDRCKFTPLREVIETELVAMLAGVGGAQVPQEA